VLSRQEQQIWDEVQRFWAEEVEEPPRAAPSRTKGASRDEADLPVAVIVGTRITIVLVARKHRTSHGRATVGCRTTATTGPTT
jgi:hypothetical protein